ncbi:hypothetical protein SAMN04489859_100274 [Paracoccus alcaliphilus]|uniref:Uncharacterized protein n=1 Tax=Paracoccus alcaliphilus TaxID=34002 RepID=A0A1H8EH70_9RHOB|nr:hypothetical protein [Paracoccus alcaliphilus]WCR20883.1 hypothetical protein JHW40_23135 [Paracoccus alcaliphilus]SEN18730.1 hypothetical protein SAMN04489859_100274 [Paracoccus alcaliphilus]
MTTATMQRRASGPRAAILAIFTAVSAMLAEVYGRVGSAEPKAESWHYFSA